ncbi:MAG: hypothetical protein EA402_11560 [Planctomycetota bacterium]|nr:MAG: hypothetical protein EA402_11560 [Planctomycetota bacterium]
MNDAPVATALSALPDHAALRVVPACPALDAAAAADASAAMVKLFSQFQREGRCQSAAIEVLGDGHLLLLAWLGPALSGCSHDKINHLLQHLGQRHGRRLLDAPPLVVEVEGVIQHLSHAEFKDLVRQGRLGSHDYAWDSMASTLGDWRLAGRRPLAEHWLSPLLQRALSAP